MRLLPPHLIPQTSKHPPHHPIMAIRIIFQPVDHVERTDLVFDVNREMLGQGVIRSADILPKCVEYWPTHPCQHIPFLHYSSNMVHFKREDNSKPFLFHNILWGNSWKSPTRKTAPPPLPPPIYFFSSSS